VVKTRHNTKKKPGTLENIRGKGTTEIEILPEAPEKK
jgi:hypothetical protein